MPDAGPPVRWSRGRASVGASVTILLIIYGLGLSMDSFSIVFEEEDGMWTRKANMGIFKACGYNRSLQLPKDPIRKACFNLLESGVPGWIRAVQFFSVLCTVLLVVLDFLWIVASCHGSFTDKPFRYPIMVMWVVTGIMLMIHPIIFACNIRPHKVWIDEYHETSFVTLYWVGFILHCVVAGAMNFITLMAVCCFCMLRSC